MARTLPENPFPVNRYLGPEYFCDREAETTRLLQAVQNKLNTVILAQRRIGKTGLVLHTFQKLERQGVETVYLDILGTRTLADFVRTLAVSVIGKVDTTTDKIIGKTLSVFAALRPQVSVDPLTGSPEITVTLANDRETRQTLESIFQYLAQKSRKKRIVVAIDEFQQVGTYPEKNTEALLRSHIQLLPNVVFFFSGSRAHLLGQQFSQPQRPFYASAQFLPLDPIDAVTYKKFIRRHFEKAKKKISAAALDFLFDWTRGITFYVQFVCNRLYDHPAAAITEEEVKQVLVQILDENESIYYSIRNLLAEAQWNLLLAIGKENGAKNILSQDFIQRHRLSSPSTVKTALSALLEKEMVVKDGELYYVYDVFQARWLERH